MSVRASARAAADRCSREEGDEICRMVLQLVSSVVNDRSGQPAASAAPEPVHTSPVYREYERLVAGRAAPGVA